MPEREGKEFREKSTGNSINDDCQSSASVRDIGEEDETFLFEKGVCEWRKASESERQEFIKETGGYFDNIVDDFLNLGDYFVKRYNTSNRRFNWWKILLIILAGSLAILNVIISHNSDELANGKPFESLPLIGAILAAVLSVLHNLESFFNYHEKSRTYRKARELLIDNLRKYEMLWQIHVVAFSDQAEACVNAVLLYKRIVSADKEIRSQLKELIEKQDAGGKKGKK